MIEGGRLGNPQTKGASIYLSIYLSIDLYIYIYAYYTYIYINIIYIYTIYIYTIYINIYMYIYIYICIYIYTWERHWNAIELCEVFSCYQRTAMAKQWPREGYIGDVRGYREGYVANNMKISGAEEYGAIWTKLYSTYSLLMKYFIVTTDIYSPLLIWDPRQKKKLGA